LLNKMKIRVSSYNYRRRNVKNNIAVPSHARSKPRLSGASVRISKKYPLKSSKQQLNKSIKDGNSKIKRKLSVKELEKLRQIEVDSMNKNDTYNKYSKNGKFTKERSDFQDKIVNKNFNKKGTIDKKDPDLYIFGGVPGSGKSQLKEYVPEKAVKIDSDEYKMQLAKKDKSPIKRFPLAHAGQLHEEATYVVEKSHKKALKNKNNIILDATFSDSTKGKKLIDRYKKQGYDVHFYGTQLKPHVSVNRATDRFLTSKEGRYVPLKIIAKKGNRISSNVIKGTKYTDSAIVIDTSKRPSKVVYTKGNNKKNYRNP